MINLQVVTGYVPIANHPRTAAEYGELGDKLRDVKAPLKAFYTQLQACWLKRYIDEQPFKVTPCEGDNPAKNSLAYHIVNHQKVMWLQEAAAESKADTFIWMDYGICHQPGVTADVINEFLGAVAKDDLAIPGCWDGPQILDYRDSDPIPDISRATDFIDDNNPCWRFCGSLMIVPKQFVLPLAIATMKQASETIKRTHRVPWEVNTLARVERRYRVLPIRWYKADHNETQFTNYEAPGDHVSSIQDTAAG
jgi:hypothetical protein